MSAKSAKLLKQLGSSLLRESAGKSVHKAPASEIQTVRAPKLSVSLYQRDLQRLDQIKEFMQQKGFRNLSDSEALRLACRCIDIGDQLVGVYKEMQGEDGRRKAS
jgi:hypothetical protein